MYEGRSPAIAAGDWRQWERAYLGVARDLLAGRLTADQVGQAVTIGRREDSRTRGARFLATIRAVRAGRPIGGSMRPSPTAKVERAVTPASDALPVIPSLAGESVGAYFLRIAAGPN